jgi:hypothetical protein
MLLKMPHRRFLFLLTGLLGIEFVVLAISLPSGTRVFA